MILQPSEYNASYFDGAKQTYAHNAGYSKYERWYRHEGKNSQGEHFKDIAKKTFDLLKLQDKKVLEIGCAKGFIVEDLRSFGVDAYGLDVSSYAISKASPAVAQYLTVGDVRTFLQNYQAQEFDFVISFRTLECFSDTDLVTIVAQLNRIAKAQYHVIDEFSNTGISNYYNSKPIEEWGKLPFARGAKLTSMERSNLLINK